MRNEEQAEIWRAGPVKDKKAVCKTPPEAFQCYTAEKTVA